MIKLFLKLFLFFLDSVLGVADPMHNFQFAGRYYRDSQEMLKFFQQIDC